MAKGGYTWREVREMSELQLSFVDHYQQKQEIDFVEKIATILGLSWDLDFLDKVQAGTPEPTSRIFLPLSLVIDPELVEKLRKRRSGSTVQDDSGGGQKVMALDEVPEESLPTFLQRPKRKK